MGESTAPQGLTRRTVAKGAAWAVPAVAVVTPTRAMAASPGTVSLTGQNCKLPGSSSAPFTNGAVYLATITNTTNLPITIGLTSFTRGGAVQTEVGVVKLSSSPAGACCTNLTAGVNNNSFTVAANSSGTYAIVTADFANSANNNVSVAYTVNGQAQPPATDTDNTGLPPIAGNGCGNGGSCDSLTLAQRACLLKAIGTCNTGNCS